MIKFVIAMCVGGIDQIQFEPNWLEGQTCMNCDMKFNISHRKHHW